ncbi:hypothetical protein [Clostridium beijerinckii]|uniref:Uncharacterized protein n=1 Tax=Clostridium beijerinckii TaxID=1520 RepID=A0AAE5H6E9_CLOBE|nr:hypothetical protein [Clostridium beijerinckii]NSB15961.1 hypothetical protein [Clostridium beijerinckii]OOM33289.1 hypothetical protein CLOBE_06270 [Clostridium beijerinckii]
MKSKKIFAGVLTVCLSLSALSQIAFAGTTDYKVRLPISGTRYTPSVKKATSSGPATNYVSYFGYPGSKILCWVSAQEDGTTLTDTSSFTDTGNVYMYYIDSAAADYYGHYTKMGLKTSTGTFNQCDVYGNFDPN